MLLALTAYIITLKYIEMYLIADFHMLLILLIAKPHTKLYIIEFIRTFSLA